MTQTADLVTIPQRLDFDALAPVFSRAMSALHDAAGGEADRADIDPGLRDLLKLRASQLNGCAYCVDLHSRDAAEHGVVDQRIHAVAIWEDSSFFTAAERAAFDRATETLRAGDAAGAADQFARFAADHAGGPLAIEATWQQWLTDFIEDDYPVKVIRLGFDQAGRLLEIGAHTLEDEGRVIVFHAMPARKRYTDVI